jgi:hypothetical protein
MKSKTNELILKFFYYQIICPSIFQIADQSRGCRYNVTLSTTSIPQVEDEVVGKGYQAPSAITIKLRPIFPWTLKFDSLMHYGIVLAPSGELDNGFP